MFLMHSDTGGQVVEDVLTSGLSAKLMRYLRSRVLGESQKDTNQLTEIRNPSTAGSLRGRDEGKGRIRHVLEPSFSDERSLDDQSIDNEHDRGINRQTQGEECGVDNGELPEQLVGGFDISEINTDIEDRRSVQDACEGKIKGDMDESIRDDASRRRATRGSGRLRGKGRSNEGAMENEQVLSSPDSGGRLGQGRNARDRTSKCLDVKKVIDTTKSDCLVLERDDNDDCFQGCGIGSKDISDLVKKAVRAAEAEARAANAPTEAIKAAGDSAAEVVKTAALEVM